MEPLAEPAAGARGHSAPVGEHLAADGLHEVLALLLPAQRAAEAQVHERAQTGEVFLEELGALVHGTILSAAACAGYGGFVRLRKHR
jgi:hypothetical protein